MHKRSQNSHRRQWRGRRVAMLELTWRELLDTLPADACGIYFTLLLLARGRRIFEMHVDELLPLFSEMSPDRFDRLVQQLADNDLIARRELPNITRWFVVREPQGWRAPRDSDEFLRRPFVN
jgi:hypothetical protein